MPWSKKIWTSGIYEGKNNNDGDDNMVYGCLWGYDILSTIGIFLMNLFYMFIEEPWNI
jgi:hypothetical protein